jgi:lipoprotein-anchoring transpeptidase ErfK/SrfK
VTPRAFAISTLGALALLSSAVYAAPAVVVTRPDEPIFTEPTATSARRGAAQPGALLPTFAERRGPGCDGSFLMVGALAWICSDGVEPSRLPAPSTRPALEAVPDGLPFRYYFVGNDGSFGYRVFDTAEEGSPDAQLFPGFGVAIRRERLRGSDPFGQSTHGLWIPLRDLRPVQAPEFGGVEIESDELDFVWVTEESTAIYSKPGQRSNLPKLSRFVVLRTLEERALGKERYLRVGEKQWVRERDVRGPRRATSPSGLRPAERWIDVDLERQVLTAYAGSRAVFATLISSGRGADGSELATPRGEHRIWVKLRSSDMDNLENLEARESYAIQAVPWVMYFERGYGLHGTFWHRAFGRVQSHGCVNLTPRDAKRLFDWTSPRLPSGWSAVFPTEYEPGTLVRVR